MSRNAVGRRMKILLAEDIRRTLCCVQPQHYRNLLRRDQADACAVYYNGMCACDGRRRDLFLRVRHGLILVGEREFAMSDAVANSPTRPRRLRTAFERSGERLCLSCRNPQWARGCFMVLWLTGWTVGCVFLVGLVIREPQLFHFLFAVPFWASWFFFRPLHAGVDVLRARAVPSRP